MASNEDPTENIVEAIMKDPLKRDLLLKLLTKEKSGFKAYKKNEEKSRPTTPLRMNRLLHCESPTALLRRRALEKDSASDGSGSELSGSISSKSVALGPKLPFEELLKGVNVFVEIIKNGEDKSSGIKTVMALMGATIKDTFTRDVTHVVFKDGSFTTFQKAKLLKVHLVSVLWIEAVRKNGTRVPEKDFPAFGSKVSDEHVSALCSQLSKEFEDVEIRDEKRRSMSDLMQLPSKENDNKSRRKTLFIPQIQSRIAISHGNNIQKDRIQEDENDSDNMASDDSDCVMIDGKLSKPQSSFCGFIEDSLNKETSISCTLSLNRVGNNACKSSISFKENSDMDVTDNIPALIEKPFASSLVNQSLKDNTRYESSNESTKSGLAYVDNSTSADKKMTNNVSTHTVMSSLRISTESDQTKSHLDSKRSTRTSKSTIGTTMSSLQLEVSVEDKENVIASPLKKSEIKSTNGKKNTRAKTVDTKNKMTSSKRKTVITTSSVDTINDSSNSSDDLETVKKSRIISFVTNNSKRNIARDREFQESDSFEKSDETSSKNSVSDQSSKGFFKTPIKPVPTTISTNSRPRRRCTISTLENEPKTPRQQSLRNSSNKTIPKNTKQPSGSLKKLERDKSGSSDDLSETEESNSLQDSKIVSKSRRKLYNPDELVFIHLSEDDSQQREKRRQQKMGEKQIPFVKISKDQKKIADEFLNPNIVKISKNTKKKTDESKNTNQLSDESDSDSFCLSTPPRTRRSRRLSVSQAKPRYVASSSSSDISSIVFPKSLPNRRSTLDFMSLTQTQQKRRLRLDLNRKTSIACTRLHRKEVNTFEETVRDLGKYYVEDCVTVHTSHLVAGEPKRTINMLRAIARGCWIVSYKWLLKSKELNRWQPEEDYEVTDFSSAVQKCRIQRQAFGSSFSMDIFKDCGCIYIGKNTSPRREDLRELIGLCQGKLSNVYRNAYIIIGELMNVSDFVCLREQWVLDSIMLNKLQAFKNYYLKVESENSPSY